MKLTFIRLFDNLLSKYPFLKKFLTCNGFFGLFTKLKRGLGIASGVHFLRDFPIKMFLI